MKIKKRTKQGIYKGRCFPGSSVEESCASGAPHMALQPDERNAYFQMLGMSNINSERRSRFEHQANKRLSNTSQTPLFTASNSLEMAEIMNQFETLYRQIKRIPSRIGRGLVNSVVNDDGLVMCSNCYYYTKIGESCWHCGNAC
jgi:hypothetical protein